jgi:hypothetical protein
MFHKPKAVQKSAELPLTLFAEDALYGDISVLDCLVPMGHWFVIFPAFYRA